jgi:hypothetical protein
MPAMTKDQITDPGAARDERLERGNVVKLGGLQQRGVGGGGDQHRTEIDHMRIRALTLDIGEIVAKPAAHEKLGDARANQMLGEQIEPAPRRISASFGRGAFRALERASMPGAPSRAMASLSSLVNVAFHVHPFLPGGSPRYSAVGRRIGMRDGSWRTQAGTN